MQEFTALSEENLRTVFVSYDWDGSGSLSAAEARAAMKELGLTNQNIRDVANKLEYSVAETISLREFLKLRDLVTYRWAHEHTDQESSSSKSSRRRRRRRSSSSSSTCPRRKRVTRV